MVPGETVSPRQALGELLPAWGERMKALSTDDALQCHLVEKMGHLESAVEAPVRVHGILTEWRVHGEQGPMFPSGDPARAALTELDEASFALSSADRALVCESSKLTRLSRELNGRMHCELQPRPLAVEVQALGRGFGIGLLAMSATVGAGCLIDRLRGEEQSTLNSPLGMGLDAGAGLILACGLPAKYKVPLAVATMVVPRVLNAYEIGPNQLAPTNLSNNALWMPNAVDGIGVGVAVGLPVDGRIKSGVAGLSIVGGRLYNAYSYKPADKNLLK